MRLLLLGGTRFLGRHLTEAALARGDEVTLFHRGKTPFANARAESLHGDRESDLSALEGRTWDAAIDTCGYLPSVVRRSAALLSGAVAHYTFVSTISVYAGRGALDEEAAVGALTPEEERRGEGLPLTKARAGRDFGALYGPLKAACEAATREVMGERALVVRPGLIVGPHDPSDRFTYWVRRLDEGGDILAPDPRGRHVQVIDVRDLAAWMLEMADRRRVGTFNAVGAPVPMEAVLAAAKGESGKDSHLTWVTTSFLEEQGVEPYTELPLWIPGTDDAIVGKRALAAGLRLRSLRETIRDTLAWDRSRPRAPLEAGLTKERESDLLRAWRF